jgi:hypothetical protein
VSLRRYTMADASSVGARAVRLVTGYLQGLPATVAVRSVERDPEYQRRGIDLLWQTRTRVIGLEVKGDRHHATGNFFFETQSNVEKGTEGCFLYTQADVLAYCFVGPRHIYFLPVPEVRAWFLAHRADFRERATTTRAGGGHYTTRGHLVPVRRVRAELPRVRFVALGEAEGGLIEQTCRG